MQVAERANACEAFDEFVRPGRPLVLGLINITWRGERARLGRRSGEVGNAEARRDHVQQSLPQVATRCWCLASPAPAEPAQ
jgi:hypothetical protein